MKFFSFSTHFSMKFLSFSLVFTHFQIYSNQIFKPLLKYWLAKHSMHESRFETGRSLWIWFIFLHCHSSMHSLTRHWLIHLVRSGLKKSFWESTCVHPFSFIDSFCALATEEWFFNNFILRINVGSSIHFHCFILCARNWKMIFQQFHFKNQRGFIHSFSLIHFVRSKNDFQQFSMKFLSFFHTFFNEIP